MTHQLVAWACWAGPSCSSSAMLPYTILCSPGLQSVQLRVVAQSPCARTLSYWNPIITEPDAEDTGPRSVDLAAAFPQLRELKTTLGSAEECKRVAAMTQLTALSVWALQDGANYDEFKVCTP